MSVLRSLLVMTCVGSWCGCSLASSKSGAACQRSTQCEPGLGCVQGKCSKDLSAIAATNTVPMLGGGMGGAAAGSSGTGQAGSKAGASGGADQAGNAAGVGSAADQAGR
jgi:hypothetical protein